MRATKTVKVPPQFEKIFKKSEGVVAEYFKGQKNDPTKGTVTIADERYILFRAASMSVEFFKIMSELFKDLEKNTSYKMTRSMLFDIAHAVGRADAKNFSKKMNLKDPIEKLSAGPAHFAYTGWAFVDIFPESNPSPDENYCLIYDHPYSFESDSWIKSGVKAECAICIMNAGYSSGWCEASFNIPLVAVEIMCKAKGDPYDRFIMAQPSKIKEYVDKYLKSDAIVAQKKMDYEIPGFFQKKRQEVELTAKSAEWRAVLDSVPAWIFYKNKENQFMWVNKTFAEIMKMSKEQLANKSLFDIFPKEQAEAFGKDDQEIISSGKSKTNIIEQMTLPSGETLWVQTDKIPNRDAKGDIIGIIGFAINITERSKMEEEKKRQNEELKQMNELMIGREEKILELKNRISELENKIKK